MDFNKAAPQQSFNLIPKGTIAKVRLTIKPGGYDDPTQDWTGSYATRNSSTDAVYLNCEFVILEGEYAKRKVWSLIGLHSPRGPEWGNIGYSFMRAILNSARGFAEHDGSPEAIAARNASFDELDGIEFTARIDVEQDKQTGEEKNVIKYAILKGHKDYKDGVAQLQGQAGAAPSNVATPPWAR